MKSVSFRAPWGTPLAVMTGVCLLICLIVPTPGIILSLGNTQQLRFLGLRSVPPLLALAGWSIVVVPLILVVVSAFYMVRGYVVTDDCLIIKRLGWNSRVSLNRLTSATVDPEAFRRSWRVFGNGGFFAFVGWFRNKKLGSFRAYATDASRAVVLRWADKTVVVTPDEPERFVASINAR